MFEKYLFEFIGTMVLILLGDGVCAATSLDKSKAKGAGWIVIAMGWGFAVMVGVFSQHRMCCGRNNGMECRTGICHRSDAWRFCRSSPRMVILQRPL